MLVLLGCWRSVVVESERQIGLVKDTGVCFKGMAVSGLVAMGVAGLVSLHRSDDHRQNWCCCGRDEILGQYQGQYSFRMQSSDQELL